MIMTKSAAGMENRRHYLFRRQDLYNTGAICTYVIEAFSMIRIDKKADKDYYE